MISSFKAFEILNEWQDYYLAEEGLSIVFIDGNDVANELLDIDGGVSTVDARLNINDVYIDISELCKNPLFVDDAAFCNVLISIGHEFEHVRQINQIRNGEASNELVYSWVADSISERYYDLNYDFSYREIAAEKAGVDFAYGVLEDNFKEKRASKIMSKRMSEVKRTYTDEYGCDGLSEYMLSRIDKSFDKGVSRKDFEKMFDKLLEMSKTVERSYSPYVYQDHIVDDLERFYTKSEENKEFIDRAVKQGNADKFICAAGICENTGHYSRNADWLPEGRSMLINMKTDMLGYLQRELSESEDKRLSVDMSTLDSDGETMPVEGYDYV